LNGGWYNTAKTVTLTASDNKDPSPKIYYSVNGGSTYSATKSVALTFNYGDFTLKYRAKDSKGNTEAVKTVNYKIDRNQPSIGYSYYNGVLNLTVIDDMDSNPTLYYRIGNGNYITASKSATI
jgi:hypothetical protein